MYLVLNLGAVPVFGSALRSAVVEPSVGTRGLRECCQPCQALGVWDIPTAEPRIYGSL
jgi:hypothetical protein